MISIDFDNTFHEGWVAYLLGEDRPELNEGAQDGWDMASETPPLVQVRETIIPMRVLGQIEIEASVLVKQVSGAR